MSRYFKKPKPLSSSSPFLSVHKTGGRVGKAKGGRTGYSGGGFSANDLLVLKRHKYKASEVAKWKDKGKDLLKVLKSPNP